MIIWQNALQSGARIELPRSGTNRRISRKPSNVISLASPLPPGSRIGILGGGQLGRMLALAAARLGFICHIYSDSPDPPAAQVSASLTIGRYDDFEELRQFAETVDVVTYEFENVPVAAAAMLAGLRPVSPPPKALEVAQDRLVEKQFISGLGIPVAPFLAISDATKGADAAELLPGILKTRRLGYDGKGQAPVATVQEFETARTSLGVTPLILEQRVSFDFEVSVLVVRDGHGKLAYWDLPRNEHRAGILHRSTVTGDMIPPASAAAARNIAGRIADALDYVGVLAVELFYLKSGHQPLIVNEIAPRVHNSGHWTMDACATDQFENHVRAICGWPLGDTKRYVDIEMVNLIGSEIHAWQRLAGEAGTFLHLYGKGEARDGRKMGHVNRVLGTAPVARRR
ncbi:MAG: 5-(carboxyamino)imidazole ribonucleotide synthase [Alphaproteobacteria bacterium]|nr:5-(carboxyamino)imidazole ribonucleotide synthase [Alphaproteobacteria bacterium]